jgi:hypothetical protein
LEPNALCGSTSDMPEMDCGADGRGAAFATIAGEGIASGSEAGGVPAFSASDCAEGWTGCEMGSEVLCNEGNSRAHKPSTPTLNIPAKIRRRITRSSKAAGSLSATIDSRNSTAKRAERKPGRPGIASFPLDRVLKGNKMQIPARGLCCGQRCRKKPTGMERYWKENRIVRRSS